MATMTVRAGFDGEVLRPEEPLPLRPETTYVVTVEVELVTVGEEEGEATYALTEIGRLAMDMGTSDLAERHDWYAQGRLPDDEP
jgi:hypothetical protein